MTKITSKKSIEIWRDDCPESPRKWSHLGTIACEQTKYDLGDEKITDSGLFKENNQPTKAAKKTHVFRPVYFCDYGGGCISFSTVTSQICDCWRSNQVGWIYASKDSILREFSLKKWTERAEKRAVETLATEVEEYEKYLKGDIYGFTVTKTSTITIKGEEYTRTDAVDSCGGFYGSDHEESGLAEAVRAVDVKLAKNLDEIEITN